MLKPKFGLNPKLIPNLTSCWRFGLSLNLSLKFRLSKSLKYGLSPDFTTDLAELDGHLLGISNDKDTTYGLKP